MAVARKTLRAENEELKKEIKELKARLEAYEHEMDPIEAIRRAILQRRMEMRMDKHPPQLVLQEDDMLVFKIPEEIYECKTAETDELTLIGEIKLFDDPYIPVMFSFYYD